MIYLSILELHSTYTTSTTTYATYYTRQAANRSHLLLLQVLCAGRWLRIFLALAIVSSPASLK